MLSKQRMVIILLIFLISLGGCASIPKQKELQIQGLRNQLIVLEAQIKSKDEEIYNLRAALSRIAEEKESSAKQIGEKKVIREVKSRPNIKQIQIALKNAGFDPGPIDGKMGRKTAEAIRLFQRANNLSVDARVGKETWSLLKEYLYKKVK